MENIWGEEVKVLNNNFCFFPFHLVLHFYDIIFTAVLPLCQRLASTVIYYTTGCEWCIRLTTLPPSCAVVMKSGNLNFLEPSGPLQACNGTALSYTM